jgi:endo-1,4-beta-D-glucanase Y
VSILVFYLTSQSFVIARIGASIAGVPTQASAPAGGQLSDRHSPGMAAAAAVGSFAATPGPVSKAFLQELWDMPMPNGEQRYFDGMLYLMSMMHAGGEFRILRPKKE